MSSTRIKKGHITVRLPQGQIELLEELTALTGQTKTELLEEAVAVHLRNLRERLLATKGATQ